MTIMLTSLRLRPLVATLVTAAAVVTLSAQDTTLRYRWAKGDQAKYRLTQETNTAMSGMPGMGEMTVTITVQQLQTMTAREVGADGAVTLDVKIDGVKMDMASPMGQMSYDSASATPPTDPIGAQIAPMLGATVGETITMVIEPDGAIRSVTGATKIKEKMDKLMPGGAAAMGPASGLDQMFTDDAMKGSFGQSLSMLPKTTVKPGAFWQTEIKTPSPAGIMIMTSDFTLMGFEQLEGREVAVIKYTQKIRSDGSAAPPAGPMTMKMEPGSGDGQMFFDTKLGRVVKTTANATVPMTMSLTGPDGSAMAMQALTKTKMTYEVVK